MYMHTCKKCWDPRLHSKFYKLNKVHRRCRTLTVPTTYQRVLADITIDDSNARLYSTLLDTKNPTLIGLLAGLLPTHLQFVDNIVVTICPLLSRLLGRTKLILCFSGPTDPNFGKCHLIMIVCINSSPRWSGKAWITSGCDITLQTNSFIASAEIVSATRLQIQ